MNDYRLSEKEQEFVSNFSEFVNGKMSSAKSVDAAMANDHCYLVNEKAKMMFAFMEQLAKDYQQGHYDQRNEWACRLAAEAIEHLASQRLYFVQTDSE